MKKQLGLVRIIAWCLPLALLGSCGDDDEPPPKPKYDGECSVAEKLGCLEGQECLDIGGGEGLCSCSLANQTGCEEGLSCEEVQGSDKYECVTPLLVKGRVFDLQTDDPIEGAHVVARDANNVATSGVAITDANGEYEISVRAPRDADGNPTTKSVTLRADAEDYQSFPTPPRVALPVDLANASGDPPTVENAATDIGMLELPDTDGLGTVAGTVVADHPGGTLVVVGGSSNGGGVTGIADLDGSYTVFNVPEGSHDVRGYKVGLNLEATDADVTIGELTENVDLLETGEATAVVSGKVEIVNPGNGDDTSIILVVEETFRENTASGEPPPGLRAAGVSGDWSIDGVPDGNYVVLAAFENDFLVRDPDTSIGGTDIVRISVSGGSEELSESFKITGSLDDPSPTGEEVVSATPTFTWEDDSSEDHYEIVVYDAFGTLVWEDKNIPGVSGNQAVTVPYGGPALESGLIYQFRATSIKNNGTPISRTEDLKGVFTVQ